MLKGKCQRRKKSNTEINLVIVLKSCTILNRQSAFSLLTSSDNTHSKRKYTKCYIQPQYLPILCVVLGN